MRESTIEKYLKTEVEKIGGMCLKFGGRNMAGMPDRVITLPMGRAFFVELKAPGLSPSKLQSFVHSQFAQRGFLVRLMDTKEKVDDFIHVATRGTARLPDSDSAQD